MAYTAYTKVNRDGYLLAGKQFNWHWLAAFLSFGLFSLALWGLLHVAHAVHIKDIRAAVAAIPAAHLLLASGLVIGGYLALTLYDLLALRYLKSDIPYPRIALASFIAYAFGHTIGLSVVSGGSVRYRIYSAAGLSAAEVGSAIFMVALTFTLGITTLASLVLLLEPQILADVLSISPLLLRLLGATIIILLTGYVAWAGWRHQPLKIGRWQFTVPSARVTLMQIALSMTDLSLVALAVYSLLPPDTPVSYLHVLGAFVLSIVIGIISHVPGGLGVFETAMVLALPQVPKDALLASLLVFRVLYYLLPFLLAALLLAGHEWKQHAHVIGRWHQTLQDWLGHLLPQVLGIATLVAGAALLFSGALPGIHHREALLGELVPLPLIEISHLLASVAGLGLLILSRGLFNRLDGAWYMAAWLLALGMVTSLLKGLDYEEASLMGLVLGLLWYGRKAFYRRASFMTQAFSPGWLLMLGVICAGSLWLGLFAYQHVEYSDALWWQFALHAHAPRFLRASMVVVVLGSSFALYKLLRQSSIRPQLPDAAALAQAQGIIARSPVADAALALTGDKNLLFSDTGNSFLMYQTQGKSWLVLGDPIGVADEFEDLLWTFREQCDLHGGHAVFYQVSAEWLPLYIDMGMGLLKLGEDALVPLAEFSLEGKAQARFRQAISKGEREQLSFNIVPAGEMGDLLPELRAVSDDWLVSKKTREKRFSLGSFAEDYLRHFPLAVVRKEGKIVAFANLLCSGQQQELSVDLMRYSEAAPNGVMDYLFTQIMLWGKTQGYQSFNLGIAPLSGLEQHHLAPVWHQVGNLVFHLGENFYNFEGLRRYKEKFHPQWQPRYMAVQGNLYAPRALLDASILISGGLRGILGK
jgi:phosphatidylglycerol lysyltransferase